MKQVSIKSLRRLPNRFGFSLIEVVVAVGIFAIAIVSVIGLLGPINKSVSDVRDFDDASRVVTAVQGTLQQAGIQSVIDDLLDATGSTPENTIYADRSGRRVALGNDDAWEADSAGQSIPDGPEQDAQKFFQVAVARNEQLSPSDNDDTAGFLAFTITLRWPAYLPDGTRVTDTSQQSVMVIPAAITR